MKEETKNSWCKIVLVETYYVLKSKLGRYNDQFYLTLDDAYKHAGVLQPI